MKRIAFFPGTFDPFTKGHEDIAIRGTQLFDEVIIGIGHNSKKKRFFPAEKMKELIELHFENNPQVKVILYQGLTAKVAKDLGACVLLRGLRNTTDFEYENSIAQANRYVNGIDTVFIYTSPEYSHLSSSIIRELHKFGHDVGEFVPFHLKEGI
ncbi:pantetheine-phosphate adenylyltransferase [Flammeovirga kamogawensis]|uniref:Phosphopantetheine adenylyltransferase n=1 Tax=Flammeovirga kamogawensis TaxID=373891 RepID=A0ABX8GZJ1_9BACT|nr:pantetheine-phosphate adenylyltransferase [Flammeovirga kamogawensis]MBB6459476.1 pantetheine-phosphate adenylyltransferase [Flammeovirga kamogawensis]QWG09028.1 pantetheine-phosphate adenylyltransferase [Flammeovirga kamogawensis]TRX67316.1 pantetheine-phosphate adenylyltransferase [Flammeovirga kamogawensis]